jgi:uncharacterized protein YybS (DUF2232 family)
VKNVRNLTEGAVLLAVFAILLLLTIFVPLLAIIVNLFLVTPFILFAAKNDGKSTFVFVIAALLLSLLLGSLIGLTIALPFAVTGGVIGYFIQKKKSRWSIFLMGSLAFLAAILVIYGASIVFFKMNFIIEMIEMMQKSSKMSAELLKNFGDQEKLERVMKQSEQSLNFIKNLIPTLLVVTSFAVVFILQSVSFPLIRRFGIEVEKWKGFKNLSLPKSTIHYFLIILLVGMVFKPEEGTFGYLAIINLTWILIILIVIQGYLFLFFYLEQKGFSNTISITIAIISLLIPIFLYMIGILGIIDLGFDLRKKIKKE